MEVTGKIKLIGGVETFGANGFRKREVVVETFDQYPQPIMIEFVQDNVSMLDQYQVGQEVRVFINLRGREWTNPEGVVRYFNSIQGWRIEQYQSQQNIAPAQNQAHTPPPQQNTPPASTASSSEDTNAEDDLPF